MEHSIPAKFIFFKYPGKKGDSFKFSSDFKKIGYDWDVEIKNGTFVDIVSDPVKIERSRYGAIKVIKIKANISIDYHTLVKEFWVPTDCIIPYDSRFKLLF